MHFGIGVAGEADVAHLALLLGLDKRLERSAGAEDLVDLGLGDHLVALPQIEVIGLHGAQRTFQLRHGFVARTQLGLGHEEDFLADAAGDDFAVAGIALAIVVLGARCRRS